MEMFNFIHPSFLFILAAICVLFVPGYKKWRWLLLLPPVIAIYTAFAAPVGENLLSLNWLGQVLNLARVDALSLIFAQVFAIMSLAGIFFGMHEEDRFQIAAAFFYMAGGFGCVFAGDYLTLFAFWELMAIASTFLVMLNRTRESVLAGFRYFIYHTAGGLLLLSGLLLRYGALGNFEFGQILFSTAQYYDWLILIGFCVNAAVIPLHAWLPDAYPRGTVIGSVFMCAFTTKTAVYVLARAFPGWQVLAIAGTIMAVYGVIYACMENNARRILSYHIVSQVGYMVAGIGVGTALTLNGAVAHAYAHILYKGLLFMSVGVVLYSVGTAKLDELGGLASRLPWVMVLYMIAALSISGMPLFNGFISKTMTIAGAASAPGGYWIALGLEIAAVGTFISVGIKLPYFAFWGGKATDFNRKIKPVPWNMYVGMAILAIMCILQGLFPQMLYKFLPTQPDSYFAAWAQLPNFLASGEAYSHFKPWVLWNVSQASLLLGFSGLAFYFLKEVIRPKSYQNLDFDYFYRLIGRGFIALFCVPVAFFDGIWTNVYNKIGLRGLMEVAKGTVVFDVKGIDGVVDGSAYTVRGLGRMGALLQNGRLQEYLGLTVVIALIIFAVVWQFS